jgi:TRAP-type C4-dicarboxylate transport system permease small subunit
MIKKILNTFEVYAGAFCLGIMIILLFLQVFSRYVMRHSFSWTEELALIFFILSIYFGTTAAIRRNQQLRMAVVLDKLKPKTRQVLLIVNNIIFIFFNCIIFSGLFPMNTRLYRNKVRTSLTGIPKWIIYSLLLFLFALMSIRLIQDCIVKIREFKTLGAEKIGDGKN